MKDWVQEFLDVVQFVVVIGDCVIWGGIFVVLLNLSEFMGMQFYKEVKGGYLGFDFKFKGGLLVINILGCLVYLDWVM